MKLRKIILAVLILFFTCPVFCKNIAVIPFQNITGDKEKNWVGAGFSETLTTKIVKVKEITVLEREQLSKILEEIKFQYSGAVDEETAVEKGKMYGADVLVFGSFQIVDDTLRVTARFVDVETRKVIDTAEANGKISDIFKLQDEIAFSLMDSLKIVLAEKEKEEIKVNPTEDLTAYQWFSKGYEALTLKLYDKAIEYYTKAIKINPKYAEAYNNRGIAYYNKGLYGKAIEDTTMAIQINPKYADADTYLFIGNAYLFQLLYDDAIEYYTRGIKLNPKDSDGYFCRGMAYDDKGLYDEAIEDYTKAIQISPKETVIYHNRGEAYKNKGLYDEAIENFTMVIKLDPNNIHYIHRGDAYYDKGLYDEAIKDFTKAIKCLAKTINPDPRFPKLTTEITGSCYDKRGNAYYKKGLCDKAISDFKRAVDLGYYSSLESLKKFFNINY
ncbi:MAG: tetratricopeptide repeat protein [Elusimicrobia bacterium]|nr:tetratricopeptide repeat protein [Elusimicrobiota bacterium]